MNKKDLNDFKKIKYEIDELKERIGNIANAKFRLKESNVNIKSEFYKSILHQEDLDKKKLAGLINKITYIDNDPGEKE